MQTKDLVAKFNALRRHPKAPSRTMPNEWHFDVRYVHLEPTPSHVIFLYHPQSQFFHLERLPLNASAREAGLAYFPETVHEAGPEIVRGLLHVFADNVMRGPTAEAQHGQAPWKFTTTDKNLASAVGNEMKRQGVSPAPVCVVGITKPASLRAAEERWVSFFRGMLLGAGYTPEQRPFIHVPTSINFNTKLVKDPPIPGETPDMDETEKRDNLMLQYCNIVAAAEPHEGGAKLEEGPAGVDYVVGQFNEVKKKLEEMTERQVNSAADRGDPEAALDYAIRLSLGLGCKRNRKRSRDYLIKAAYSPTASDKVKATAHGLLINWYLEGAADDFRLRYLYASCHHANAAASLAKLTISPTHTLTPSTSPSLGDCAAPNVLRFMKSVIEKEELQVPVDVHLFFKDMVTAYKEREAQMQQGIEEMCERRMANPNRYRCAAVDCDIETDTGSKLTRCAGQCDKAKKPYYCSVECQRSDWSTHRDLCRPNAPCSVLKYQTPSQIHQRSPSHKTPLGALLIPITAHGRTTLFSSSTMTPRMMKQLKRSVEESGDVSALMNPAALARIVGPPE